MSTQQMSEIVLADRFDVRARAIPGAFWHSKSRTYRIREQDVTPRAAAVILKIYPELALTHPRLAEIRDELVQDVRPFDNATPFNTPIKCPKLRERMAAEGRALYRYQELDLGYIAAVLEAHGGAYIGWDRGMGKTLGAIALIEELDCQHTLVICPNTAKDVVWRAELEHWLPDHEVLVLPNRRAKRESCLAHVRYQKQHSKVPLVLVVHYEALAIIRGKTRKNGWDQLGEWDLAIADEAHRIKNPKAQMSRAIKTLPARRRLCLSGSIIENHAEELFSPLQWLFPDYYRSRWRDWNDRFLDYVEGGYSRVFVGIKLERLPELRDELGRFMVYRRKEDELDLPERVEQTLYVELSPSQRKVYEQLRDECLAKVDDENFVAAQDGLPLLAKLRQVATGLDLVAESVQDSSKLDVAVEMIEDAEDEAFVVFSWYKAAARALADRLGARGIGCFVVDGDVPHQQRQELIDRFMSGEGRVFIGTISTLGESVNLQRASSAIFLDHHWNPGLNAQATDRIYRIGQERKVTITHLVAKDTVDEHRVMPSIANKEALRALILGDRR